MDATQGWDGRVPAAARRARPSDALAVRDSKLRVRLTRGAIALALALLALALTSNAAFAGDYTVSMGEVFGCANHSWSHSTSMSLYNSYDLFCTGASVDDISAAVNQNGGRSNGYDNAQSNFVAPAGTWISHADLSWSDGVDLNHNFGVGLRYEDGGGGWHNFATCWPNANGTLASETIQSTWPGTNYDFAPGTQQLGSLAVCLASWCDHTPENGQWAQAYVEIHSAQITLHEDATPSISYFGGGLPSGSWLRGVQNVGFNSSDYSGIRRAQLWIDGNRNSPVADTGDRPCDYTNPVPCSNISGGTLSFDTSTIANGVHTFRVSTENAAGNWTDMGPTNFYVDNAAPGEVKTPSVEGGQGWHTTNSFTIDWTNPSDVAPITTAYYEICDQAGQNCQQASQSGQGISKLTAVQVPAAGTYKVRVWVGDAAGNTSSAKSPFLTLAYDGTTPGAGVPAHNNGWVNAAEAKGYRQEIDPPSPLPVSYLAGYAVSTDGSDPGSTATVAADPAQGYKGYYTFADLPEGYTTVKARAISGAGIASTQVGSTVIQVDKTPPTVVVSGNPDPTKWSRTPVGVEMSATDAVSGMAPAPPGDSDPTHGAYVDYSVDGGGDTKVAGGSASASVAGDGTHAVTYQAFDVAGNGSAQKSVYFKIDQTPPVAGFETQDASDPARVSVIASDATSGLADGGAIALRPAGSGSWTRVPTTHDGTHYYAHLDPATMAPGTYELEALIPDQAGNVTTTSSRASDGGPNSGGPEQIVIDGCRVNGVLDPACVAQTGSSGGNGSNGTGGSGASGGTGPGSSGSGPYTVIDNLYQFELGPDGRPYDDGATVATFLRAGIATTRPRSPATCAKKPRAKQKKTKKKCRPAPSTLVGLVPTARLKFGQGATVRGDVTLADHTPLGDVDVLVLQRYDAAGMRYTLLRTITTDRSGAFTYHAPAGPG